MGLYTEIDTGQGIPAGLLKSPFPGGQSHWTPYVTVPALDAAVQRATKLGARLEVPRATLGALRGAIREQRKVAFA